ncbi:MAG: hypothetical protein JW959_00395 [Pirellulales bacterium]|nr:hypothetical protein [Pirellulales bacterium]
MGELFFTSTLDHAYREDLEALFCHNGNQKRMIDAILAAIERYGTPTVSTVGGRLWITFDSGIEAQSLFVLEKADSKVELVGVVVYTREDEELVVIFTAVREDRTRGGTRNRGALLLRMVDEVRSIGHRIKGITSISVFADRKTPLRMSLGTAKDRT